MADHIEVLRGLVKADREYDEARKDWDMATASDPASLSEESWRRISDRFEAALMDRLEKLDAADAALAALSAQQVAADPDGLSRATEKLRNTLAHKDGHHSIGLTKRECAAVLAALPAQAEAHTGCDMGALCIGCSPQHATGGCPDAAQAEAQAGGAVAEWQYRRRPGAPWQRVPEGSARCLIGDGDEYRALYTTPPPGAVPEGMVLSERDKSVMRFALHRFMGEAYARHNEASQKTTPRIYAPGAAEAFYQAAKDAERLLSMLAAAPGPKENGNA